MQKSKTVGLDKSLMLACTCGVGVVCTIDILLALAMAFGLSGEHIDIYMLSYLAPIAQFASILIGVILARKICGANGIVALAITGGVSIVMRICVDLLFFDGVSGTGVVSVIITAAAAVAIAYFLTRRKNGFSFGRKKRRRR